MFESIVTASQYGHFGEERLSAIEYANTAAQTNPNDISSVFMGGPASGFLGFWVSLLRSVPLHRLSAQVLFVDALEGRVFFDHLLHVLVDQVVGQRDRFRRR